jgi:IS5 family transposase
MVMKNWSRQMNIYESVKGMFVPENHPLVIIKQEIKFDFVNKICDKFYAQSGLGRKPYKPELMFKIIFLSHFSDKSYREIVCELQYNLLYRDFCDHWEEGTINHSSLSVFLDRVGPETIKDAFNRIVDQARKAGIITDRLSSVDSTIVESHANKYRLWVEGGSPDPDATWLKKGKETYYGFKSHTACDVDSDMVTKLDETPAHQSDMTHFEPVVEENAEATTADKGYSSSKNRDFLKEKGQEDAIIPKVNEKKTIDKQKAKDRTQVERNYSVVKNCHRLGKTISWGLDRFIIQSSFAFMAWNAKCWLKSIFKEPYYILMAKCA